MKIDYDFKFANLKGEVTDDAGHAGEYLANVLASDTENTGNAVKFHSWALSLYKREPLTVDKQDAETLQKFITGTRGLPAMIRSQLKEVVDKAIDKPGK